MKHVFCITTLYPVCILFHATYTHRNYHLLSLFVPFYFVVLMSIVFIIITRRTLTPNQSFPWRGPAVIILGHRIQVLNASCQLEKRRPRQRRRRRSPPKGRRRHPKRTRRPRKRKLRRRRSHPTRHCRP